MTIQKEFSAYKKYSSLVESMVNQDEPVEQVTYFYESINLVETKRPIVRYFTDVDQAIYFLQRNECIVVCKIGFSMQADIVSENTHAICFVHKKEKYYLYDSNGPVLADSDYKFNYRFQPGMTTKQLITSLYNNFNIKIDYEKYNIGIQAFAPDKINTSFISGGGYCMFFIYLFARYLVSNWDTIDIASIIHYKYKQKLSQKGIFKYTSSEFENITVDIINNVFLSFPPSVGHFSRQTHHVPFSLQTPSPFSIEPNPVSFSLHLNSYYSNKSPELLPLQSI